MIVIYWQRFTKTLSQKKDLLEVRDILFKISLVVLLFGSYHSGEANISSGTEAGIL